MQVTTSLPTPVVDIPAGPRSRNKDTAREYPRASPDTHIRFAPRTANRYSTAIWYERYKCNWVPSIFPPSYVDLPQSILRELGAKSVDRHQMSFNHFALALKYPKLYPEAYKYEVCLSVPSQPLLYLSYIPISMGTCFVGSSAPLLVCRRCGDGHPSSGTNWSSPRVMAPPR